MFNDADDDADITYHDVRLYRVRNPVLFFKSMCTVAVLMTILYLKFRLF